MSLHSSLHFKCVWRERVTSHIFHSSHRPPSLPHRRSLTFPHVSDGHHTQLLRQKTCASSHYTSPPTYPPIQLIRKSHRLCLQKMSQISHLYGHHLTPPRPHRPHEPLQHLPKWSVDFLLQLSNSPQRNQNDLLEAPISSCHPSN